MLCRAIWAKQVVENLLPAAAPLLQRRHWLRSRDVFATAALLHDTFNVLARAVPRRVARSQQCVPPPAPWGD
eukprot:11217563-Lingulodinium_polyedra.AAC.1